MPTIRTDQRTAPAEQAGDDWEDGAQEPEFKPLSREEARQWRARQPQLSPWRLVGVQVLVGLIAAALGGLLTQSAPVAWSVLYGAASGVLPAAAMAWGTTSGALSRLTAGFAQAAFAGFLMWEGVKILLTVAMLWSARYLVPDLSWLGLLAGLVLVLKVYGLGFWLQARRRN
ncbi:MAG: ATP synthase subunit I [Burkholderiales bacterium]|nr:MAG: ATP synthase subunit I [Burkholderiales bacterium]